MDLTTNEAADILNITPRHVRALIRAGQLPAEKLGRGWAIKPKTLEFEELVIKNQEAQLEQLRLTDPEKFATMTGAVGGSGVWSWIDLLARRDDLAPPWGSFHRSKYLKSVWQNESKLAGVLFSMQSRIAVTGWTLSGPVTGLQVLWRLFAEAEEEGWIYLIRPLCEDYLATDNGGVIQVARDDDGNVAHLYHLPGARCIPGPVKQKDEIYDLLFLDVDGQWKGFNKEQFYRLCSMPSTDPLYRKLGFCFMSRVLRSARLATKLVEYKEEKLSNLPPEGIASVTGLTRGQVEQAITLYEEARKQHQSLTFPGVLWLVANTFGQEARVDFTSFRDVWEGFDEEREAEVYMKTVSLDAGTDVGEFWQLDVTGATRAAGERQHRKSLGKGPFEFMVDFERFAARILPELYHWRFDEMDDEQDALVERIRAARIANILDMWRPDPVGGEGLITTEQAQELLALWRVVPQRFFQPQEAILTDIMRELSGGLTIGTIDHRGFVTVHRQYWQLDSAWRERQEPLPSSWAVLDES